MAISRVLFVTIGTQEVLYTLMHIDMIFVTCLIIVGFVTPIIIALVFRL